VTELAAKDGPPLPRYLTRRRAVLVRRRLTEAALLRRRLAEARLLAVALVRIRISLRLAVARRRRAEAALLRCRLTVAAVLRVGIGVTALLGGLTESALLRRTVLRRRLTESALLGRRTKARGTSHDRRSADVAELVRRLRDRTALRTGIHLSGLSNARVARDACDVWSISG
jgi:hypothetical protein